MCLQVAVSNSCKISNISSQAKSFYTDKHLKSPFKASNTTTKDSYWSCMVTWLTLSHIYDLSWVNRQTYMFHEFNFQLSSPKPESFLGRAKTMGKGKTCWKISWSFYMCDLLYIISWIQYRQLAVSHSCTQTDTHRRMLCSLKLFFFSPCASES